MDLELVRLPPLMLDWLGPDYITRDELDIRGYDLPCYPSKAEVPRWKSNCGRLVFTRNCYLKGVAYRSVRESWCYKPRFI